MAQYTNGAMQIEDKQNDSEEMAKEKKRSAWRLGNQGSSRHPRQTLQACC